MLFIIETYHGNICRSPMAEMILRDMVTRRGLKGYVIDSAAVSREEIGNPVYPPPGGSWRLMTSLAWITVGARCGRRNLTIGITSSLWT